MSRDDSGAELVRCGAICFTYEVVAPGWIAVGVCIVVGVGAQASSSARVASPSRVELVIVRNDQLYAIRGDGTGLRRLIKDRARDHSPAWSPDGSHLAFVSERGNQANIVVADAHGMNTRQLTHHQAHNVLPAWSPDGRQIAFASDRSGGYEIYLMNRNGDLVRRVTRGATSADGSYNPAWSPDGRMLAFASSVRTPQNLELYSVQANGRSLRRLTHTNGNAVVVADNSMPNWSPDGRTIVFSTNRTGDGDLWVMRTDGTRQHRLAGLAHRDDWNPRFSPDGTRIAFESRPVTGSAVYLVRADGTHITKLIDNASEPSWRPSATK